MEVFSFLLQIVLAQTLLKLKAFQHHGLNGFAFILISFFFVQLSFCYQNTWLIKRLLSIINQSVSQSINIMFSSYFQHFNQLAQDNLISNDLKQAQPLNGKGMENGAESLSFE